MLDLQRLRALHLFAMHGTIAAAAESLGYSPAAVSQQLATLERETGTVLLERTARSATLTPAGRVLAARAREILDAVEAAQSDALAAGARITGEIVVSTIPTAAAVLAPVLAQFMATHPDVSVVLHQSSPAHAVEQLRSRDLDLAVVDEWQATSEPDIARHHLARDPLLLTLPAGHRLATQTGPVTLSDLGKAVDGETWLCAPHGEPSRVVTDHLLVRSGGQPSAVWELEGLTTIGDLVARGVGLALLPALALHNLPAGSVATRPLRPASHRKLLAKTRPASRAHPLVSACVHAIQTARW
jgi:DNA-binding transcriptional LysR family regulator